jgi:hypothetical protein
VKRRRFLLGVVVAAAGAAAGAYLLDQIPKIGPAPAVGVAEVKPQASGATGAESRWATLPRREGIGRPGGELFLPQSWSPPPAPAGKAGSAAVKPPPEKPAPPALPYRVAGKMIHGEQPQIVLAKGDAVYTVREGDTLDDGYQVLKIRDEHVMLLYLPLGVQHTLALHSGFVIDENFAQSQGEPGAPSGRAASAEQPAPAQLRWA